MSESVLKQELPQIVLTDELLTVAGWAGRAYGPPDRDEIVLALRIGRDRQMKTALAESAALREEIAKLTLLSDSQLANQERLVGEMQELRQERDELLYHSRHASPDDVEWHSPQTVGHLRRQLETLDPNMAIGCAYFVDIAERRIARVTGVSMSYERIDHEHCLIDSKNKDISRGIIIWAHTTDAKGLLNLRSPVLLAPKDTPAEPTLEK